MRKLTAFTLILALAACQQDPAPAPEGVESISLDDTGPRQAVAYASPDTSMSGWMVAASGTAILFGNPGEDPFLTLECELTDNAPPQLAIIRHAEALPGQTALFPFIGNGMRSRFFSDATLHREGDASVWRWETHLPADDPQLDIFAGTREMTATLPGRGMLEIPGSRIPGQFLDWCRNGGEAPSREPSEDAEILLEDEG